jgi:hypothetical protein
MTRPAPGFSRAILLYNTHRLVQPKFVGFDFQGILSKCKRHMDEKSASSPQGKNHLDQAPDRLHLMGSSYRAGQSIVFWIKRCNFFYQICLPNGMGDGENRCLPAQATS